MITTKQIKNTGRNFVPSIEQDEYYVPIVDGEELNLIAETEDIAMLLGIGRKYDGSNSHFAKMACRMLNITSAWSE